VTADSLSWRKAVRIEHTSNSRSRSTVLKTARDTSPNSLPLSTLAHVETDLPLERIGEARLKVS